MISIKIGIEAEVMTILSINMILFDSHSIIEKCILEDKYIIQTMIDSDSDDYEFIETTIAQKICKTLKIALVELVKY